MSSHLRLWYSTQKELPAWLPPYIADGQFGVNVFFVISGFLITSLLLNEESDTAKISFRNFYTRRILRIFPAYYFLLFTYFLLAHFKYIYISKASWFTALSYTNYFNDHSNWYIGHIWSLSVEENFYLLWPLFFTVLKKSRKLFVLFIMLLIPIFRAFIYTHPIDWAQDLTIFTRVDSIATGCALALYKERILKIVRNHWYHVFYISTLLILLLPYLITLCMSFHLPVGFIVVPFGKSHGTIANILISFVILFSIYGPKGYWFKFLNSGVMNYIGILSYSLYLWQQFFIYKTGWLVNVFPLNIVFLSIAALASYYLIEKPFIKLKSKFSS